MSADERKFVVQSSHGRAEVDLSETGVPVVRYVGLGTGEMPRKIQPHLDHWIQQGHTVTLFVDAVELQSYETAFRTQWTTWMRDNRKHLPAVHILFRSKIVEMGISLVNPLIGGLIKPWSNRAAFERALAHAKVSK